MAHARVYTSGVQLSTHDFLLYFCSFFYPFPRGGACFCPVFWSQVPTKHGGERVFLYFFAKYRGQSVFCQIFLRNTGGNWASNMLSPVFFSAVGFLGVSGGSRACTEEEAQEEEKEEADDEEGEEEEEEKEEEEEEEKEEEEEQQEEEEEEEEVGEGEGEGEEGEQEKEEPEEEGEDEEEEEK